MNYSMAVTKIGVLAKLLLDSADFNFVLEILLTGFRTIVALRNPKIALGCKSDIFILMCIRK
jgi:hypothetical protein